MSEWANKTLGEVALIERGKFTHRPRNDPRFYGGETPFVQTGDVTRSNGTVRTHTQTLNEEGVAISKVFPAGTILITIAANIGYAGILEFDSAAPDSLIGISVRNEIRADFLNFYLMTQQPEMDRLAPKGTQKNINIQFLKPWPVPLPPLPEQKKIAHILSTVQRAVEAQERIIQTTTELKKALMHKLFTEGLRNEPQKQTEIGPVPESWGRIALGELCEKPVGALQTGPFGSQLHKDEYQKEGIAVVNPTHLAGNRINHEAVPRVSEEVAQRLGKHRLREFDILFARRGEIGRQSLVTKAEEGWLCGTGCFLVRAAKPIIDNRFLSLFFATEALVKWLYSHAAGAIMPNLNNKVMQRLPVFYPDSEAQQEIVAAIASIDGKTDAACHKKSALQDLFRTLLHELMTAKTRVANLDLSTA